ncbi:MAG: ATP synthase F1 subunit epsilon [Candidatus Buchananbacteria bacterium RIFCSPHIGHO2_02_FULL_38_8]|uniref:ATP synthase epsilon chain n=2 Tax=Candidatus Buchananiibacteriota TaxID=1817903 RepID=A0A1G1XVY5_9BACT|nr:hypothetical protein [uncultured bacterium]OGY44104.1 MAG: ATP synthase F1 subunit epsilon [Candidatus Buchananbacteria bacterium RIFCSPHIGHO2_01_FULL_39_8]OGY47571.1 MAG: ATP synthase F1 subunit epsilon [Candidatus Buchananbacteria bacterium RIFCSPHIGHO2_02_FULL_38_8]
MTKINLEIITPERTVFADAVDQITLPTQQGEITVLPNHIPLISSLAAGEVKIIKEGQETFMAISGGLIQIDFNKIRILADTAERAEEIDEAKAEEAHKRALALMSEKNKEAVDYTSLAAKIEKELARLKVARRRKHQTGPKITNE